MHYGNVAVNGLRFIFQTGVQCIVVNSTHTACCGNTGILQKHTLCAFTCLLIRLCVLVMTVCVCVCVCLTGEDRLSRRVCQVQSWFAVSVSDVRISAVLEQHCKKQKQAIQSPIPNVVVDKYNYQHWSVHTSSAVIVHSAIKTLTCIAEKMENCLIHVNNA